MRSGRKKGARHDARSLLDSSLPRTNTHHPDYSQRQSTPYDLVYTNRGTIDEIRRNPLEKRNLRGIDPEEYSYLNRTKR
jgi:hypothetical protein